MNNMKKILITIIGIFLLAVLISNVSAYKWACLSYGDSIPHYTCDFRHCKLCLDSDGYSTSFGYCNKVKNCVFGIPNNDTTPPILSVNSPVNNYVYNSSKVLFDLTTNEHSTIYYKNNANPDSKFKMIAGNRAVYNNQISFRDGFYNITIRAQDSSENNADVIKSFYVDTKKPKIDSPKDNSDGSISFKFEEANPSVLKIVIGNNKTGYISQDINLNNCNGVNGKYICNYNITRDIPNSKLKPYEGLQVESWIELKDISGKIGTSKKVKRTIDLTAPNINNPSTMFSINGNYGIFNISISEKNILGVYYNEKTSKDQIHTLCTNLKDGICYKKVLFSKGDHDIMVFAIDKSGNYAYKEFIFAI